MTSANRISRRLSTTALTLAVIAALSPHVKAQEAPPVHVGYQQITGLPSDWSHHHVIYGDPGTEENAIKNGTHEQWLKIVNDPRYVVQQLKRHDVVRGPAGEDVKLRYWEEKQNDFKRGRGHDSRGWDGRGHGDGSSNSNTALLHRDWSMDMGANAGASSTGTFSTTPDTNSSLTITGNGSTLIIQVVGTGGSSVSCTYAGGTSTVHFRSSGTTDNNATALVNLINIAGCGSVVGVTASHPGTDEVTISASVAGTSGQTITLLATSATGTNFRVAAWTSTTNLAGGKSVGSAGTFPAKYSTSTASSVNCSSATTPDYVVYPAGGPGSASNATIIAYDNIYNSCAGANPLVYWAYNSGTGTVENSPVLSYDGTQVAFIETPTSGAAVLRILRFAAGEGADHSSPATPAHVFANGKDSAGGNTAWSGCGTGSCMISVPFQTPAANLDSNSSPFYDFDNDFLYVGDDLGVIHKFSGVFRGTPAEVTTSWPVTIAAGTVLTSPVLDPVSGSLFVGSSNGKLYQVTTPTTTPSAPIASGTIAAGLGIVDSPVVDTTPATPVVYVFVGDDNGGTIRSAVYQFANNYGSGTSGIAERMGAGASGSATLTVYDGDFDNIHYSTAGGTSGSLYFCGGTSGTAGTPFLYRIAINGTFTGAITSVEAVASGTDTCSPLTEFFNNGSGGSAVTTLGTTTVVSPTLSRTMTNVTGTSCVSSNTGIVNGDYVLIDSEIMHITGSSGSDINCFGGSSLTVTRAALGSVAAAHNTTGVAVKEYDITIGSTTLNGTITAGATTLVVASSTGIGIGDYININTEDMLVTNVAGTTLTVTRAALGTTAAGHTTAATVNLYENTLPTTTTTLNVASGTNIGTGDYIEIGSEIMGVTAGGGTTTLTVSRAALGSTAATGLTGANITIPSLDWLFLSLTTAGSDTGCTGACLYNYDITTPLGIGGGSTTGQAATGGTSGIIIDNGFTSDGASQIYYTTLSNQGCVGNGTQGAGTGGCAIQASQGLP